MNEKIVIIGNSPTEALRARLILETAGYRVSLASVGEEVLTQVIEQNPDLVILDEMMPQMNGYEVFGRLRLDPATKDIPVIMLVSRGEEKEPGEAGDSLVGCIAKPYEPADLISKVEKLISTRETLEEEEFRYSVQALGIGRVVLKNGYIISADRVAQRILRLDENESSRRFIDYLCEDPFLFFDLLAQAEAVGRATGEFRVRVGEGEKRWWQIAVTQNTHQDHAITQLAFVDITEWTQAEKELQWYLKEIERARQALSASKRVENDLLAIMSHELRTPLHEFIGLTGLVLDTELTEKQHSYLSTAKASANSLLEIINNVLDLCDANEGQLGLEEEAFDLGESIEQMTEIMSSHTQEKGLEFSTFIAPDVPRKVVGDPRRLRQVLANLVSNAVKFTERGKVTIRVGLSIDRKSEVEVHFLVHDTGIGIPEDKLDAIFRAFEQVDTSTTRRYSGLGLGLPLSRHLVELMGGKLWVESEVGHGSTFHFTVVLKRQDELAPRPTPAQEQVIGAESASQPAVDREIKRQLRILLAEDSPTNQIVTVANLEKAGHEVTVVDDGWKAIEAFAEGGFQLVLMDIGMPELDGLDATRAIREMETSTGGHVPIIALTAFVTKEYRKKCLEAGMDTYLAKPIVPEELYRTIDESLPPKGNGQHTSQPSTVPPVDLAKALEVVNGDIDLLGSVVESCLAECPEQVEGLRDALARQDAAGIKDTAHRLKGVLGNIGALDAHDLALQLETIGKEDDLESGTELLKGLEAELERVEAFYTAPGWETKAHQVQSQPR